MHRSYIVVFKSTLYTMAPQVLQGVYSSQADLWSVGVMTYMLLSSHRPFYSKKRRVMINNIMTGAYDLKSVYWNPISDEAKDMVNNLLIVDPSKRMNASEALEHKWLSKEFSLSDRKPDASVENAVKASLVSFRHTSELKKIALNVSTFVGTTIDEVNITFQQNFLVSLSDFSNSRLLLTNQAQMKSCISGRHLTSMILPTTELSHLKSSRRVWNNCNTPRRQ